MPRLTNRIICCFLMALSVLLLSSCSLNYEYAEESELGIGFGYSKLNNNCFAASIPYSANGSTDIIIPNEFNNAAVTQLGGYIGRGVSAPFLVTCDNDYFAAEHDLFSCDDELMKASANDYQKIEIENILFKITLPDKLKTIENTELCQVSCGVRIEGQEKTLKVFRPVYYFEISKDNKYFYTEDGKLYYKETDELFSDCIYEKYE